MTSILDQALNSNKNAVRYQIAFYKGKELLGGLDIERKDIAVAVPDGYGDIEVNGVSYEIEYLRNKYLTEFNTVVFRVYVKEAEAE